MWPSSVISLTLMQSQEKQVHFRPLGWQKPLQIYYDELQYDTMKKIDNLLRPIRKSPKPCLCNSIFSYLCMDKSHIFFRMSPHHQK